MEFPFTKRVSSPEGTKKIAEEFSWCLRGDEVIVLNGELGTGKTFFIKGVLRNLDVKEEVSSPTFTLINEYEGKFKIYHFDFYRINKPMELIDIGYYDYFNTEGIIFIEWGNLFPGMIPGKRIEVKIEFPAEQERERDTEDLSRIFSINKYE